MVVRLAKPRARAFLWTVRTLLRDRGEAEQLALLSLGLAAVVTMRLSLEMVMPAFCRWMCLILPHSDILRARRAPYLKTISPMKLGRRKLLTDSFLELPKTLILPPRRLRHNRGRRSMFLSIRYSLK